MAPQTLRRFALAAFFTFSVVGLVSVLIESSIRVFPWRFVVIQAISYGAMAGTIVLFGRRHWWATMVIIAFWIWVMMLNGGGLSFVLSGAEGLRVHLDGPMHLGPAPTPPNQSLTIGAPDLDQIYVQRGIIGAAIIILVGVGYRFFLVVIREQVRTRARLETEVQIAKDIQESLLPEQSIEFPSCSISGKTIPTSEVGGDYHDIVETEGGRIAVAIADVTGHGVGAGIMSAMTKSALHLQIAHDTAPGSVLTHLNRTLYEVSDNKTFVTFAYALIDPHDHTLHIATAGHPPVLHRSALTGSVTSVRSRNPALGMQRDVAFVPDETIHYGTGDLLLMYTDGISEATNASGEQFGDGMLQQFFGASTGTPQQLVDALLAELLRFTGRKDGFEDDVSVVVLGMK